MLNKVIYTIFGISLALVFFPTVALDSVHNPVVSGSSIQRSETQISKPALQMAMVLSAPILTAKSALALDLGTGTILYSNNQDEPLPIASLTKLMTALVVTKQTSLSAVVTIKKTDLTSIGSTIGLVAGEKITVDSLLQGLLIPSGNDAALALSDFVGGSSAQFVQDMNSEALSLGLSQSHFANPVGWDSDENYSDTWDLAKIAKEVLKNSTIRQIVKTKQTTVSSIDGKYSHELTSTNLMLLSDPEVAGLKTGFTSKALGNLIILDNHQGHEVLTIVLGSENREQDTQKLLDWLFTVYSW